MSEREMQNEKLYQATMAMTRSMLNQGLITEDEYRQIDTIFTEKYAPSSGTLFSDIDLINVEKGLRTKSWTLKFVVSRLFCP